MPQFEGYAYPNEATHQPLWGVLIVVYPYITGLVAGAFIMASLVRVFNVKALEPVYRLSLLTAFAFLLCAPLPLGNRLPSLAACRRAAMEGPECCGSFSSTSSSTELSAAVTIANQAEVIGGAFPRRQLAAPAPLLKGIIGRLLPRDEQAIFAAELEGLSRSQVELLAQLARQRQLAVLCHDRSHARKVL